MRYKPERALTHDTDIINPIFHFVEMRYKPERALTLQFLYWCNPYYIDVEMRYKPERALTR